MHLNAIARWKTQSFTSAIISLVLITKSRKFTATLALWMVLILISQLFLLLISLKDWSQNGRNCKMHSPSFRSKLSKVMKSTSLWSIIWKKRCFSSPLKKDQHLINYRSISIIYQRLLNLAFSNSILSLISLNKASLLMF